MDGHSLRCPVTKTCCYVFSITNAMYCCCLLTQWQHGCHDFFGHIVLYDALVPILPCLYVLLFTQVAVLCVFKIFSWCYVIHLVWSIFFLFCVCAVITPKYVKKPHGF